MRIIFDIDDTLLPTVTEFINQCYQKNQVDKIQSLSHLKSIFSDDGWQEFLSSYNDIRYQLLDRRDVIEWIKFLCKESFTIIEEFADGGILIDVRTNLPPIKDVLIKLLETLDSSFKQLKIPVKDINFLGTRNFEILARQDDGIVVDDSPKRLMEAYEFINWETLKVSRPWNSCIKLPFVEFPFHIKST